MPIKIKIATAVAEVPPQATVSLKVVQTLGGKLLINDSPHMDIVIDPVNTMVSTLPKPEAEKDTFDYQREFFYYLFKKGVLEDPQLEGGPVFGMVQAPYVPSAEADVDPVQSLLYQIEKYIQQTEDDNLAAEEYDDNIEDNFVDPPPGKYTPYGSIPPYQDTPAGQQDQFNSTYAYAGYGYLY